MYAGEEEKEEEVEVEVDAGWSAKRGEWWSVAVEHAHGRAINC